MRLFVALDLPEDVARSLLLLQSGVPGARWHNRNQLHLTLRFIGEVDGRDANAIDDALVAVSSPAFSLALHGVGEFGGKYPHALWVGVRPNEALLLLQRKIERNLQRIGLVPDTRKFWPHITIARLKGTPRGRVMDFLTDHALYASVPFHVKSFVLYSSVLTPNGSLYRSEQVYDLKSEIGEAT